GGIESLYRPFRAPEDHRPGLSPRALPWPSLARPFGASRTDAKQLSRVVDPAILLRSDRTGSGEGEGPVKASTFAGIGCLLERFFRLRENRTPLRTEFLGGATTFATMAYIIVVTPAILQFAGLPVGPSTVATILVAVVGSLLMGLYANRPLAVAPYMGENAFIAFGLTALGIGWQLRLGAVFVSGLLFLLITLLHIRSWLADSISSSMKHSFAVGIGLFLAFVGLYQTGIVTSATPPVPVKLGNFRDTRVLLAVFGFVLTATLLCWRFKGAILLGIIVTATAGYLA